MKIDSRFRIEFDKILSFMKLESISVEDKDATQSGVGKKFLIISFFLTVLLIFQLLFVFYG